MEESIGKCQNEECRKERQENERLKSVIGRMKTLVLDATMSSPPSSATNFVPISTSTQMKPAHQRNLLKDFDPEETFFDPEEKTEANNNSATPVSPVLGTKGIRKVGKTTTNSSLKTRHYGPDHPLSKLRMMRESKERRQMVDNPLTRAAKDSVSCKIKGVCRRELPGQACYKCKKYYEAAGLDDGTKNKVSRHRATHERQPSPKHFFGLDIENFCRPHNRGSEEQ